MGFRALGFKGLAAFYGFRGSGAKGLGILRFRGRGSHVWRINEAKTEVRGCFTPSSRVLCGLTGYRILGQGTGRVGIIWLGRV